MNITFYGGEPLLNFSLIRKSVAYAIEIFQKQKIMFSITTNGTLITPEIAKFCSTNNINILLSLDGPKEIHDRYRKTSNGNGSYQNTIRGLRYLYKAYGKKYKDKVKINMVYAPPYTVEEMGKRINLWKENEYLSNDLKARLVYYIGPRLTGVSHKEEESFREWAFQEYISKMQKNESPHPIAKHLIENFMALISQRTVYENAAREFPLNSCCIPGLKRIYTTTSGNFKVCEQIPISAPYIGNIKKGVDIEKIYEFYYREYSAMNLEICKRCWAINICDSCYVDGFGDKGMSSDLKKDKCIFIRLNTESKLYYFLKALEIMPQLVNYLQSIKLT